MSQSDRVVQASKASPKGCLIEVDFIALDGMRRMYDACAQSLGAQGVKLDAGLFVRYLLGAHLEAGLNKLLAGQRKTGLATNAIAGEIQAAFQASLAQAPAKAPTAILTMVKELVSRGIKVGLLTQLPEDAAKGALAAFLEVEGVTLIAESHGVVGGFTWDVWRRAIRKLQMVDRLCAAFTVSGNSSKAAVAAGLSVIALTHDLTEHQDFSGVDCVAKAYDSDVFRTLLEVLRAKA